MKKLFAILFISCFAYQAFACTTFLINSNGELVFGRNYDWVTNAGIVNTNLRGLFKTSAKMKDGKTISWISKYGSITFNQYGKEFPTGGMNEKGLVVELMWLTETIYPKADKRAVLQELQWVQYQLDNCQTIDEVIATDSLLRVSTNSAPLHFLIADANGNAATIEYLDGKFTVHKNSSLEIPVLTNSTYESSKASYKSGDNSNNSLERFATACSMVTQFKTNNSKKPAVDFGFDILNKVSQGDFTKWSIVYDIKNKKVYFKTNSYSKTKSIGFSAIDFSCTAKALNLDMNQELKGDITASLQPYSSKLNEKIVNESVIATRPRFPISDAAVKETIAYPATVKCKDE
jgi:penicillin V acylase-like amidase (Ntn superfamily)